MNLNEYLEELTDNNWHTLRELIELERGTLSHYRQEDAENALECAIAYMTWASYSRQAGKTLADVIKIRLDHMEGVN